MSQVLSDVLNSRAVNGLHGNRVLQFVGCELVSRDANWGAVLQYDVLELADLDTEHGRAVL